MGGGQQQAWGRRTAAGVTTLVGAGVGCANTGACAAGITGAGAGAVPRCVFLLAGLGGVVTAGAGLVGALSEASLPALDELR